MDLRIFFIAGSLLANAVAGDGKSTEMATSWAIVKKDINTPQAQLIFFLVVLVGFDLFFLVVRLFFFGFARTIISFPFFFLGIGFIL